MNGKVIELANKSLGGRTNVITLYEENDALMAERNDKVLHRVSRLLNIK